MVETTILDGGLATELEARGHRIDDPLWSTRVLIENPDAVREVHRAYVTAGADCVTTATYQASLESSEVTPALLRRAVEIAREAGAREVAASIGPYGASLANGAEYTGDSPGLDGPALETWHEERFAILADSGADVIACETIPRADEAEALARLATRHPDVPLWFSFFCPDDKHLPDGTLLREAVAPCARVPSVRAIGVNCTPPAHVSALLDELRLASEVPGIVYPNAGETYDAATRTWRGEADVTAFARLALEWRSRGARWIGGCCRVGPAHIRSIADALGGR